VIIVRGRSGDLPTGLREATFTGTVWADPVLPATDDVTINTVTFTPGARTFWHEHERGQILHVLAGSGLICTAGMRPRMIRPGDVVWVPPRERHWHGAAPDTILTHLAVSLGTTAWSDEVADTDYTAAPEE
jgi:quercetin dioxygenase-like cupin family protein